MKMRKFLSFLLVLCLITAVFPVSVFAAELSGDIDFSQPAEYDNWSESADLENDGYSWDAATMTLKLKDFALDGGLSFPDGSITIELYGDNNRITGGIFANQYNGDGLLTITGEGALTIEDNIMIAGSLTIDGAEVTAYDFYQASVGHDDLFLIKNNAKVTATGSFEWYTDAGVEVQGSSVHTTERVWSEKLVMDDDSTFFVGEDGINNYGNVSDLSGIANYLPDKYTIGTDTDGEGLTVLDENGYRAGNFTLKKQPVKISIEISPREGGVVEGEGSYEVGETVTLTAIPNDGYKFVGWTENGKDISADSELSFTAAENRILGAIFVKGAEYTVKVSASPEEGGTVQGGGTYDEGKTVTVSAVANDGYKFVGWTENDKEVSAEPEYSFTASDDRELCAVFEKLPAEGEGETDDNTGSDENTEDNESEPIPESYTITITATPEEGGTVDGGGTYDEGETVTVSAVPNDGYKFVGWMENGKEISTEPEYSFTASADKEISAVFEKLADKGSPDTADGAEIGFWMFMMTASLAGCAVVLLKSKKTKKEQ